MMKFLIFDTETTALISNSVQPLDKQPHIIEFYGCVVDETGRVFSELEFMCNPGIPITAEITRITGIKPEDVKGLPGIDNFFDAVIHTIETSDAVVAHNLSYDMAVVDFEAQRLGKKINWPKDKICTVENTEHLKGHRLSLSALHEHLFGASFSGAHRAKVDVEALTKCFLKLLEDGEI